jgi:hypothetical protein
MVGSVGELLHGLELERERGVGVNGEGEREQGCSGFNRAQPSRFINPKCMLT